MSFSLNDFKNNFQGGARPNLFACTLTAPDGSGILNKTDGERAFSWMAQTASIPGTTVGVIEVPYMGRTWKIPGNRTFEEWSTTVVNDEDFALRTMLESWDDNILGRASNIRNHDSYQNIEGNLRVVQLDRKGSPIREYVFHGAWPSAIGAIELGWESNDALETFDVTWTYSWWETHDTKGVIGEINAYSVELLARVGITLGG